jgi:hypothetical protein
VWVGRRHRCLAELANELEPGLAWRAAGRQFLQDAETVLWSAEGE